MIRAYNSADQGKLVELLRLNTPLFFHPDEEQDFIYYLENHAQHYFVLEDSNTIIGSGGINYFDQDRTARIAWDIIHPDFQAKGFGSKLTQYRIEQIKLNPGVEGITVRTTQLVYKFYEKSGFELLKTEPDFWAQGFDLYHMELKIK
jgi:[ribosomal protein S18]-alanine N-acetyltransferase